MIINSKAAQQIEKSYINKKVRVTTNNSRIFEGNLVCVDYQGNIILHDTIAQIIKEHNCSLNYKLNNLYDQKLRQSSKIDKNDPLYKEKIEEYIGTHYYFGSIMITGNDIAKIQMEVTQK